MANKKSDEKKDEKKSESREEQLQKDIEARLPKEIKEKFLQVKEKLEKFKSKILEKFDKYIVGIALLPPPKPKVGEQGVPLPALNEQIEKEKDLLHVMVLIDDTEPTKMSKQELIDKLSSIMESTAKEIDEKIRPQTLLLSEVWQNCYDGKYELLQLIALSAPIYDTGMLSAIKISEVHKTMTLKKFEKYIVAYVLAGSIVQGKATKESDIDVFIVIDDTDVKRMSRVELKDKLRAIIIGMGIEAAEITGIKNKINIQVYILTDFWDSMKEANPVIFTFLRDGVPFYDRGIFMPWKQLLKMGKVKPSAEAIDMYMSSGEQMLERVRFKLRDIGTEDFFWSIFTPSQAALMLYGVPPPAPKETPELMREIFVKKEKLLEDKYIKVLEKVLSIRKEIEYGQKKVVKGQDIDELLTDSEEYLKRIKKLFSQIEKIKEEESMLGIYDTITTVVRDVLKLEGVEKVDEQALVAKFDEELVSKGRVPSKYSRLLKDIMAAKKNHEAGKLIKVEVEKIKKISGELIKHLVEYMQRKRGRELDRARVRVKYGEKFGEITILGKTAYIIRDIDAEEKVLEKAEVMPDGSLGHVEKASFEEIEKSLAKIAIPPRVFIMEPFFESLKKIYGKDVEILVNA